MSALKKSQYVCIIAKTRLTASVALKHVLAWACSRILKNYPMPATSVYLQASNDYGDPHLMNDVVLIFRNSTVPGFSHETVDTALSPLPPISV